MAPDAARFIQERLCCIAPSVQGATPLPSVLALVWPDQGLLVLARREEDPARPICGWMVVVTRPHRFGP